MKLGLVFDLDGTLIDSAPAIRDVGNMLMAEIGLAPLDLAETRALIGRGARCFCADALAARGVTAGIDAAHRRFEALYSEAPAAANVPYPGAGAALEAFADAGVPMAICTNKPAAATRHVLEGLGLDRFFASVVAGDTLPERKPDPAPLLHAARALGAARTLFVGDSEVDADTASAAGVGLLLHTGGYRRGAVADLAHLAAFSHFRELPALAFRLAAAQDAGTPMETSP